MDENYVEIENDEEYDEDPQNNAEESDDSVYNSDDQSLPVNTFDTTLPTTHSYLGNELEVLRGRTLLDNGIYLDLPLWPNESHWSTSKMVLFPGQTLPIMKRNPMSIAIIRKCMAKDRTFGVCCSTDENSIGTTAEIYEYSEDPGGFEVRVKAKGRQRFRILRTKHGSGMTPTLADVKILPDCELGQPFYEHRLLSLDRLRVPPINAESAKKQDKVAKYESHLTPWPAWIYHQFDSRRLSMEIHTYLQFLESRGSNIPTDPTELSFWVAQNMVVSTNHMMLLLEMDSVTLRLQMEVKLLKKLTEKLYICKRCSAPITKQTDVFPMNQEGICSAYCNPGGLIHETMTVYRTQSLWLDSDPPSTHCSWFPGYAWTIACCSQCHSHMGWRFTATTGDLRPKSFWGLTRNSLESVYPDSSSQTDEWADFNLLVDF